MAGAVVLKKASFVLCVALTFDSAVLGGGDFYPGENASLQISVMSNYYEPPSRMGCISLLQPLS